ncbi:hypothetical protein C482_03216 [Natrialba chahannaoensis JCM 10990]|uniref:Uncharacterized protein n=1 Tax=Natrialba chahannaoensis JCM 10990 TaxID=1227492 RepID=M0B1H9_9EURY|nr:hypothetical protein [Natrialba chahannaoensis]ELZ04771.1 hypothetical protein C482_03216 [Natrialba chahannaoensis JCM 10990]
MKKGSGSDPFADHEAETDDGADQEGGEAEPDSADADASSATTQETVEPEQETTDAAAETVVETDKEAETDTAETNHNSSTPHSDSATSTETTTFDEAAATEVDLSASSDGMPAVSAAEQEATKPANEEVAATSGTDAVVPEPPQAGATDGGIPWVYVRDNVKQDRGMVQFYLRDYLVDAEDEFVAAVSDELGTEVSKTDVREAAYEAAMHNVDDVVERLETWGFESAE